MTTDSHDPMDDLDALGVTVVWAPHLDHVALWLPEDGLIILNSQLPRGRLCHAIGCLIPQIAAQRHPRASE